jgi:hypothetical protein
VHAGSSCMCIPAACPRCGPQPGQASHPCTAVLLQGDGSQITVEPGLIGGEVNKILAAHQKKHNLPIQYKIGPDPSSIDSCMIGGIVANNSSGMCCGVSQNTYHTLKDMRVVFVDGTVLDTADPVSCANFMKVRGGLRCAAAEPISWAWQLQEVPMCCQHSSAASRACGMVPTPLLSPTFPTAATQQLTTTRQLL